MKDSSSSILMGMMFINFWDFGTDILIISVILAQFESWMVSYDRCLRMTNIPQEDITPFNSDLSSWPQNGKLEFKNFNLRYRDDTDLILKDLNFFIESEHKIGVVGRTGAGKSTLSLAIRYQRLA